MACKVARTQAIQAGFPKHVGLMPEAATQFDLCTIVSVSNDLSQRPDAVTAALRPGRLAYDNVLRARLTR
jgi:hypothetical protein